MKKTFVLFIMLIQYVCLNGQKLNQPVDYVNPNIGGISPILATTVPLVSVPNSMMRVHKMPGEYQSEKINGFPFIVCNHRLGTIGLLMPTTGNMEQNRNKWKSYYDHDFETCTPYYYSVWLKDPDINLEFTVAEKSVFYQIDWNKNDNKNVMLALVSKGNFTIKDEYTIEGYEMFGENIKVSFYIQTNKKIISNSFWSKKQKLANNLKNIEGDSLSVGLAFDLKENEKLGFKMGVSYIDLEQAKKNLQSEIPDWNFEALKNKSKEKWNTALGKIEIEGGTSDQRVAFYTALYRTYERMVNISEDGRYYSGYDNKIHDDNGSPFFIDDWMWDSYHAAHPLHAMINPELENLKIKSFIRMYEQSSWMPSFPVLWGDAPFMNGNHSAAIIADAYFKGIRDFDIEKAYSGIKKNAMEATMLPWRNGVMCSLDSFYLEKGYYPALNEGEKETVSAVHGFEKRQAVSLTLGYSYDDWCIAQIAKALNKTDDYNYFMKRSQNYRNVYNSQTGFFAPRTADGNWVKNFDPKLSGGIGCRAYFAENNGWTYLWDVQHDIPGLIELFGGNEKFVNKLDQLFVEELGMDKYKFYAQFPDATGNVGQFVMGNEPSLHIPFLYNFAGAPWKTQERVRMLLDTWFTNSPFGMPGDEDGGGLSAFVVFANMGFFPVTPGKPEFSLSSSVFTNIKINLGNNKFFIIKSPNSSKQNKYIQKATLNGKVLNNASFSWKDIKDGGELIIDLGNRPNYNWGK